MMSSFSALETLKSQVNEEVTQEVACIVASFGNAARVDRDSTFAFLLAVSAPPDPDIGMQARW